MMITALHARTITENVRAKTAWDKLFKLIDTNAKLGNSMVIFDEESENAKFEEHRKEVKKKLEELGYRVDYSRVRDSDDWYGESFHNRYVIYW